MFKKLVHAGVLALMIFSLSFQIGLAQTSGNQLQNKFLDQVDRTGTEVFGPGAATQGDLVLVVGRFIRIALSFVGLVLLIILIYAGFLWMTAAGNEDRVKDAKQLIQNGIVGLIIVISSLAISEFVLAALASTGITGETEANSTTQQQQQAP